MHNSNVPNQTISNIGRYFTLLFNRALMYDIGHPSTRQLSSEFLTQIRTGLALCSPLVLILNQDQILIEEKALDSRLNTAKMLAHFKNAGVQSISFVKGLQAEELTHFLNVFIHPARYPDADSIKSALEEQGAGHIRINHVFYRKETADAEVIERHFPGKQAGSGGLSSQPVRQTDTQSPARQMLRDDLETAVSIQDLLEDPAGLARVMFAADLSASKKSSGKADAVGNQLIRSLAKLKKEIDNREAGFRSGQLESLAEAVYHLRRNILDTLVADRPQGINAANESVVRKEADDLTHSVFIRLIKEEYRRNDSSFERFARFLSRLMPNPGEMRTLLPQIRDALITEGMPAEAYRQLMRELDRRLQNDEIGRLPESSAAQIGMSGQEIFDKVRLDPEEAVELIYLAAEIRKKTGDPNLLPDLLVDYIERIGSKIALESSPGAIEQNGDQLRQVISGVESELISRLSSKDIDADVLYNVARRLSKRLEGGLEKLQTPLTLRIKSFSSTGSEGPTTVLNILEESVTEGNELDAVLKQVRRKYDAEGLDENDYDLIYKEIRGAVERLKRRQPADGKPKGILNRRSTLYILEKEIARSIRYGSAFSVLMISIIKVIPEKSLPYGGLSRGQINYAILEELTGQVRSTDIIGMLDKRNLVVLMPMTIESESKTAMRRILKMLQNTVLAAGSNQVKVRLAGSITTFDHHRTPTLEKFVQLAETEIFDMVNRLRNIQALY